jgi:hypothetical protein
VLDARAAPLPRATSFTTFAAFARKVRSSSGPGACPPTEAFGGDERAANDEALAVLGALASVLRAHGYGDDHLPEAREVHACFRLAAGAEAPSDAVEAVLGRRGLDALVDAGWAERGDLDPSIVRLAMAIFASGPVLSALPRATAGRDTVYLGPDSLALFRRAWEHGGTGRRAVDLATGNGFIAAAMAMRYDRVLAADLSTRCVAAASLLEVLNPTLAGRIDVVRADVAEGLTPGCFDLVTANPPWVPEDVDGRRDPARRFAAGGPTGFELPRRFLDGAACLLAPGGHGFVSCLDLELADGRRPLRDHVPVLERTGCAVVLHRSTMPGADDMRGWVKNRLGTIPSARHVIVELVAEPA